MATWVCEGTEGDPCGTLYAVGLFRCPRCHGTRFHEFGSRPGDEEHPMAKSTRLGGPSDKTLAPADEPEVDATGDEGVDGEAPGAVGVPQAPAAQPFDPAATLPTTGNVEAVLAWVHGTTVDGDPNDAPAEGWQDRALLALDAEHARDKPRAGVIAPLERALADDTEPPAGD